MVKMLFITWILEIELRISILQIVFIEQNENNDEKHSTFRCTGILKKKSRSNLLASIVAWRRCVILNISFCVKLLSERDSKRVFLKWKNKFVHWFFTFRGLLASEFHLKLQKFEGICINVVHCIKVDYLILSNVPRNGLFQKCYNTFKSK